MTCATCGVERSAANLTAVGAERFCPECLYAKAIRESQHQTLAPAPVDRAAVDG